MGLAKILKLGMALNNIAGITDTKLCAKLQLLSKDIVAGELELREEWIINRKWIVIPTESEITIRDAKLLSNACKAFNYKECFAVITEPEPFDFACYKFSTTEKGILGISSECRPNHHLLMPEDQGFAILRPFGLYSLVAGSKKFVEMTVGSNIEIAREMFWEFASTDWQESDRSFLKQIARKYQSISSN